ncbi:sensor histidine kinase [Serpentinimonas raichei]|nr:histidine kinase [Serpentinimonas raichei]
MTTAATLPDFRNLGVWLRVLLLAQALRLVDAVLDWPSAQPWWEPLVQQSVRFDPPLLATVLLLYLLQPVLARTRYRRGLVLVLCLAALVAALWHVAVEQGLGLALAGSVAHSASVAALLAAALLFYFDWRQQRLSPALAEARLAALQARIRPHFLFNSLNSVLALLRSQPQQAEAVLHDLADLYRALLSDARTLVPLAQELALARAYIEIETVRLGPQRLRMQWRTEHAPLQALVPPLLLQPLLENAVRYGVEPAPEGAEVSLEAYLEGSELRLFVRNSLAPASEPATAPSGGNHMALGNIRERLQLHFDADAQIKRYHTDREHVVLVRLPLRRA